MASKLEDPGPDFYSAKIKNAVAMPHLTNVFMAYIVLN
jgi:hypothetical protein